MDAVTDRPDDRDRGGPPGGGGPEAVRDREILALAVPAFFALVAEPMFLLADSAIVGRLGTAPLAGLGVASAVLASIVGLCVFLAYATTAAVARRLGAGDLPGALADGIDGLWLALVLGSALAVAGALAAEPVVALFGAAPDVAALAVTYLRWAMPGLPGMLVVMAATGVLRGLQDTRTPLAVASVGAVVNAGLNALLVLGWGWGLAGSAIGTSATQIAMGVAVAAVVVRGARAAGAPVRPRRAGILRSTRSGMPLVVRTLALRAALLLTTWAAARQGSAAVAAHQVASAVWGLLALALDALAIAAQALTGRWLGAGDAAAVRAVTSRMVSWGCWAGAVVGVLVLACRPLVAPLFTSDPAVRSALMAALAVVALAQPLAGYVFVLDGVLIGAGDGRFLAVAGTIQFGLYVPVVVAVAAVAPGGAAGLAWLWAAFAGWYMLSRAVFLGLRERGQAWMVLGAVR